LQAPQISVAFVNTALKFATKSFKRFSVLRLFRELVGEPSGAILLLAEGVRRSNRLTQQIAHHLAMHVG
jgi:hypothetical protein